MGQSPTSLPGGGRRETRQLCAPSSPPAPALPSGAPSRRSAPGTIGSTSPSPPLSCTQRIRTHTIHAHAHHEPSRRHGRNASAGEGLRKNTTSVRRLTGAAAAPSSRPRTGIPHRSTPGDAGAARARPSCLRPRPSPWWCLPPRSPPRRRPPWARATTPAQKRPSSSCRCRAGAAVAVICMRMRMRVRDDGTDGERHGRGAAAAAAAPAQLATAAPWFGSPAVPARRRRGFHDGGQEPPPRGEAGTGTKRHPRCCRRVRAAATRQ